MTREIRDNSSINKEDEKKTKRNVSKQIKNSVQRIEEDVLIIKIHVFKM